MNDWRSGLLLRTFQRLALRVPLVALLFGGCAAIAVWLLTAWATYFAATDDAAGALPAQLSLIVVIVLISVSLVMFSIMATRRPLWERHTIGLKGLVRGTTFGLAVLFLCILVASGLIYGTLLAAPLAETPRAYVFLHRSGLIAIVLLCTSPGVFALVVSVRERQGYSTITRIWRIDRAQTVRGIFLIMVLTTCVAAVTIVGVSISLRAAQSAVVWYGVDLGGLAARSWEIRAGLTTIFTIIAFTTAHVVQYERIRDWESGGDVTGVFD